MLLNAKIGPRNHRGSPNKLNELKVTEFERNQRLRRSRKGDSGKKTKL